MSCFLTAEELACMQGALASTFPDTATIIRRTYTDDDMGGQVLASQTSLAASVYLTPLGGSESEITDRLSSRATWIAKFPAQTDVRVADLVTILGSTFEVDDVWAPRSLETYRRATLSKIE